MWHIHILKKQLEGRLGELIYMVYLQLRKDADKSKKKKIVTFKKFSVGRS